MRTYKRNETEELIKLLEKRADDTSEKILPEVEKIIADVKKNGDKAVIEYNKRFDNVSSDEIYLSEEKKKILIGKLDETLKRTIEKAAANIKSFHQKQVKQSWVSAENGTIMGQKIIALNRVGLYVPGGTAAYPSSVLMCAIPAVVAGVKEIVLATPPKMKNGEVYIDPAIVYAAEVAGVGNIIMTGGAQAIAAMAYGTESIKRVDKIAGPGNAYVTAAKRLVYGTVDIDMLAGPSEVLIIADERANPEYIAADLLSQAEHNPDASSILITTSEALIQDVSKEINRQLPWLTRREIADKSLASYGAAIIVGDLDEAAELSDRIAPEHLELAVREPFELLCKIKNAGAIFLGDNTPEPLGDYMAGPNHVLPTSGTARYASGLSVDSFIKRSNYLYFSRDAFDEIAGDVIRFSESEGLDAHANSISVRMNKYR